MHLLQKSEPPSSSSSKFICYFHLRIAHLKFYNTMYILMQLRCTSHTEYKLHIHSTRLRYVRVPRTSSDERASEREKAGVSTTEREYIFCYAIAIRFRHRSIAQRPRSVIRIYIGCAYHKHRTLFPLGCVPVARALILLILGFFAEFHVRAFGRSFGTIAK